MPNHLCQSQKHRLYPHPILAEEQLWFLVWVRYQRCLSTATESISASSPFHVSGVAGLWSQGGHRVSGGRKSPSTVQGQSPGGGLGMKPPEASLQLSNAFLCRFVAESVLHLPLLPKKTLQTCANAMPNTAGAEWSCAHPWLCYCISYKDSFPSNFYSITSTGN